MGSHCSFPPTWEVVALSQPTHGKEQRQQEHILSYRSPALGEIDANVQSLASAEALGRAGGVSLSKGQRGGKKARKSYGEEEEEEYEEEEDEEGDSSVPDPQDIEINYDELPLDEGEEAEEEEEEVDNEEAVTESSKGSKKARLSIESAED
ncbi:hypothetical protein H9Q69_014030 [Fusarium xylarioides]|nr:hypothetical protein H9Q70_006849 [Fusarium xylarioides]KAG5779704.1 hypothetical protein H9Q73_006642 [Fusarium xylarioides]KAG5786896.1 hypothetical protein H9Q69_014030 [Fusarium xylarioides]KAG5801825.1 hypothetical protein H9Q71_013590 [Fusarium xylarioides]